MDVLAKREPFYGDAARIWSLAERGRIEAQVSVISFNRLMRSVFTAVPLNVQVLSQAIDAGFRGFEDAIQFHSAVYAGAGCLITRDANHLPATAFPVLSPAQFLALP